MKNLASSQIEKLTLNANKPILIVDADEVLVLFAAHFSDYLNLRGWRLNLKGYRLDDAIENIADGHIADRTTYQNLINSFIKDETLHQPEAPGASRTLAKYNSRVQILILTNVPFSSYLDRIENLKNLGINYPVVANTGLKGPALRQIQKLTKNTCIFIDDNPHQINSAAEFVPEMVRFHFTACEIVKKTMPLAKGATHRPKTWEEVATLLEKILN